MTISSATRRAGPFAGNGATTAFPFAFKVFTSSDVAVYVTAPSGVQTRLSGGYTVNLSADQDSSPGGTVSYAPAGSPMAAGYALDILGDVDFTQETDITNSGRFLPQVVENALDKCTILAQQLRELLGRALKFPVGDTASGTLPGASSRAGKYLAFDGSGAPIASPGTSGGVPVSAFMTTVLDDANAAAARSTLGAGASGDALFLAATAADARAALGATTVGAAVLLAATALAAREALNAPAVNYLDNPDGAIYQRTIAATADDVYMDDRWYALTQTAAVTPSQVGNPEDGYRFGLRITQSQATAQRMGRAQIIDGRRTSELRGKTVTAGGRLRMSTAANLRFAILAWSGAEDAVTSDVVSNWTSGTFTVGNFFIGTTMSLVATNSTAMSAAAAANVSVTGSVPSTATNLIVFYWTEAAAAQSVTLDAWGVRLVEGSTLVDYVRRSPADELARCQRFYEIVGFAHQQSNLLAGASALTSHGYAAVKRANPSTVLTITTNNNFSAVTVRAADTKFLQIEGTNATGGANCFYEGSVAVSADL